MRLPAFSTSRVALAVAAAATTAVTTAACRSPSAGPLDAPNETTPTAVVKVTAPDTLRLHAREIGSVDGGRLVVRFLAVESDSRCPSTAICVWQGDAAALLHLTDAGGRRTGTTLHTTLQPKAVEYAGYDVALAYVEPYPDGHTPIDSAAYVAVLSVKRK